MSGLIVLTFAVSRDKVFHIIYGNRVLRGKVSPYLHCEEEIDFGFGAELGRKFSGGYVATLWNEVGLQRRIGGYHRGGFV